MFPAIRSAFPAIRTAIKEFAANLVGDPITLDLKAGGVGNDWYARNGFPNLYNLHSSGGPSWSGQPVSVDTARNHSVVWACERIISESMAFMPLNMMQVTPAGKVYATHHPMYAAMHHAPNDEMSAMSFRETQTSHCLMTGNCDARIMRRSGTNVAYELYPLLPTQVNYDRDSQGRFVIVVKESPVKSSVYTVESGKPHDILHVPGLANDGIRGYSVIEVARNSIGTAQAGEKYAARFFAAGGRTPWLLEMAQKFKTKQEQDQFAEDFTAWLSDQGNWHKGLILEPGMTYKNMGMSPQESQFIESRSFEIPEICRWFLISPDMVGDLSRTLASNVENLYLRFIKQTLTSWMTRFEQGYWRCILTPDEKTQGYFFRHNANGLMRGDFASRMAGYATALQNGYKSIDEVRDLEDDNALTNGAGKAYHIQLNMATLPGTGTPMVTEQGILNRMAAAPKPAPTGGPTDVNT